MDESDFLPQHQPKTEKITRNLEGMSVEELRAYIDAMKVEIARVEETIREKSDVLAAAEAMFRKPAG